MLTKIYIGGHPSHRGTPDDYTILNWLQECNIDGATFYRGRGVWKNTLESCVIVEIVNKYRECLEFAKLVCKEWNQESVLVVCLQSSPPEFINVNPLKLSA